MKQKGSDHTYRLIKQCEKKKPSRFKDGLFWIFIEPVVPDANYQTNPRAPTGFRDSLPWFRWLFQVKNLLHRHLSATSSNEMRLVSAFWATSTKCSTQNPYVPKKKKKNIWMLSAITDTLSDIKAVKQYEGKAGEPCWKAQRTIINAASRGEAGPRTILTATGRPSPPWELITTNACSPSLQQRVHLKRKKKGNYCDTSFSSAGWSEGRRQRQSPKSSRSQL